MKSIDIPNRDTSPRSLFNPLKNDFIADVRDDNNEPQTYIIHSMEIETFPAWLANVLEKKLITMIKNERNVNPAIEEATEKIKKEVEVVL